MDDFSSYQKEIDILEELIVAINLINIDRSSSYQKNNLHEDFSNKFYNMDYFSSDHEEVERKLCCNRSGFCIVTILPSADHEIPKFGHKNIVHRMIDL